MKPAEVDSHENLRRGVYLLPNLLTTGGLFAGFYSIVATMNGNYLVAGWFVLIAAVFDGLDGKVARMTNTTSKFGVEYDSLADLVAFGVAPGLMMYAWALKPFGKLGWLAAFLYVVCGALRLARFNVQITTVESKRFVGLPIPAAAGMAASLVIFFHHMGGSGTSTKVSAGWSVGVCRRRAVPRRGAKSTMSPMAMVLSGANGLLATLRCCAPTLAGWLRN